MPMHSYYLHGSFLLSHLQTKFKHAQRANAIIGLRAKRRFTPEASHHLCASETERVKKNFAPRRAKTSSALLGQAACGRARTIKRAQKRITPPPRLESQACPHRAGPSSRCRTGHRHV